MSDLNTLQALAITVLVSVLVLTQVAVGRTDR